MYLLGSTKYGTIVFGEFGITHRNGYPEFTASFNTVAPFAEKDYPYTALEHYQDLVEGFDSDWKEKICQRNNIELSELPNWLMEENGSEIQDYIDCSLYPNIINVDGIDYYFESSCCGQHDTRNEMVIYVNKEAYDELHKLWDKYHLKEVDESVISKVNELEEVFKAINEEQWIADYIRLKEERRINK